MDCSRHTVTKYLSDKKTHSAINSKLFKRLNHITDQLYEVELVKSEIENREPIIVGFFILKYAKLRMLELYYNFLLYDILTVETDPTRILSVIINNTFFLFKLFYFFL